MSNLTKGSISDQFSRFRAEVAEGLDRLADRLRNSEISTESTVPMKGEERAPAWDRNFLAAPHLFEQADFPRVEVSHDANEVVVRADMPGLTKDEFNIEVSGHRLMIRGERQRRSEKQDRDYVCQECSYGSFLRTIQLPAEVDGDATRAEYRNGILTVTLPKAASARAKHVQVNYQ